MKSILAPSTWRTPGSARGPARGFRLSRWAAALALGLGLSAGALVAPAQDTDDDSFANLTELNTLVLKEGRMLTDHRYSRSPLVQRSAILGGTALTVPEGTRSLSAAAWTIECWYRPSTASETGTLILRKTTAGGLTNFALRVVGNVPRVEFQSTNSTAFFAGGAAWLPPLPANEWSHLAGVWDPANFSLSLYVNSARYGAQFVYAPFFPCATGPGTTTLGAGVRGRLDEVRIWNSPVAEADLQVNSRLFGAGKLQLRLPPTDASLLACYSFDDDGVYAEDFTAQLNAARGILLATFDRAVYADLPQDIDTDADGLPDWWEQMFFPVAVAGSEAGDDFDGDGLTNIVEYRLGTNPRAQDTNNNGIRDGVEDADRDGLSNADELTLATDPMNPDTDDDGVGDGNEIDPNVQALKQGRQFTSPTDSRSPLLQRSMVLDGAAHLVPAVAPGDLGDRLSVTSWTVEAWVNLASGAETGTLIARTADNGRTNFCLRVENNEARILFQTATGAIVDAGGPEFRIPAATWTHLAGVWDAARNTLELFVNGTSMRAQTSLVAPYRGESIGRTVIGAGVRGYIDEVRVWSEAQTSGQIALNRDWFGPGREIAVTGGGGAADIVFLVDATGSMGGPITTVKENMTAFALALGARGIDFTLGGVVYRDSLNAGDPPPAASGLWTDVNDFITWTDGLTASGGGDGPEDGLGAIELALNAASFSPTYRPGAQKIFVLITDTDVKNTEDPGDGGAVLSMASVIADLTAAGVVVHVVTAPGADSAELATGTDGLIFDIGSESYETIFDTIAAGISVTPGSSVSDLVAWYPFDDGENTTLTNVVMGGTIQGYGAEDYTRRLDWDYSLRGVAFSTNAMDLRGQIDDDGDGMPDWWENLMLGSLTPVTNIVDGTVSFARIGNGSVTNDLDADGLNDLFEYYSDTNPLDRDTDNDGVLDPDEDRDTDGLSNLGEALLGSDPTLPDTDDDGLPDGYEVAHLWDPADSLQPMFHRALQLGGAPGDYVEMPNEMRFALSNWTVEAWVRPASGWAGGGTVLSRQVEPGVKNWSLGIDSALRPVAGFGAVALTGTVAVANDGATWTHLAATMDYTNHLLRIYVDGVERGRKWMAALPRLNGVGPVTQRVGESFAGEIDEVRVWRGTLGQDVLSAFSHGVLTGSETDLVAYYRFDDGTSFDATAGKGTSDRAGWLRGQVEDFTATQGWGWLFGWRNAGTLHGNAGFALVSDVDNFLLLDSDSDGMPDAWELTYGLDPASDDAQGDADGDGVSNLNEYLAGTNPNSPDTNQNGVTDYNEDPDLDGLTTGDEQNIYGTNPGDPDTDDDTFSDGDEVNWSIPCAGRHITDPRYSRSPLVPRSLVLDGTAIDVRGRMQGGQPDRFDMAEWAVEFWYMPTNGAQTGSLVVRDTANGRINLEMRIDAGLPQVRFQTEGGVTYRVTATQPLQPGVWTHLAGAWNPSDYTLALYVNGDGFSGQAANAACAKGKGSLRIGAGVVGLMDQLMIWGVARTQADILADMNDFGAPLRGGTRGSIVEAKGVLFFDGTNSFADAVLSYVEGDAGVAGNTHNDPTAALGAPDFDAAGSNTVGVLSLGISDMVQIDVGLPNIVGSFNNGFVQLELQDVFARANGDARPDLYIFEDASREEPVFVFISEDGDNWEYVGLAGGGMTGLDIDTAPLNPLQVYPPDTTHFAFWGIGPDVQFTYWFEQQPPTAVPIPNTKTYRYVWLVDNGFNLETGLASVGMPGADIDAVGVKSYLNGDIVAWYPFDDGGRSAEDYAHLLDWDYALPGVSFASGSAPTRGEIDNDADGIPDWWETQFFAGDADPNADVDGDGLTAFWEYQLDTNPLSPDSDGNGVMDGDEDFDNDGLSNLDEILIFGSDPTNPDTDDDGFTDGDEIDANTVCGDRSLTSPVFSRSPEIQRSLVCDGTARLLPSMNPTNGLDRFNLSTWTLECWVRPQGVQTGDIVVRTTDTGRTTFGLGLAANVPVLEFTTATGTRYVVGDALGRAIATNAWTHLAGTWDPVGNTLKLYVNGLFIQSQASLEECALGSGTVRIGDGFVGHIDELRIWSLVRSPLDVESSWDWFGTAALPAGAMADIVYVIDTTGSMGDEIDLVKGGVAAFVNALDSLDVDAMLGGVDFRDSLTAGDPPPASFGLVDTPAALISGWLDGLTAGGGGDEPEEGLEALLYALDASHFDPTYRAGAQKIFVLVTDANTINTEDGDTGALHSMAGTIAALNAADVTVHVVTSPGTDTEAIARGTGGLIFDIASSDYTPIFDTIAETIASGGSSGMVAWYPFDDGGVTAEDYANPLNPDFDIEGVAGFDSVQYRDLLGQIDTDQDAIPDWWEELFFGVTAVGTNKLANADPGADLDGDGLNNLYEYYCQTSPTDPDTDNDGYTDGRGDFDADGLENHEEQVSSSDPRLTDTDDDGYSDSEEYAMRTDPAMSTDPLILRSMELKGAGDYLEMPLDTRFALTNWTVEAWICPVTGWAGGGNVIQRLVDGSVANYTLGVNTAGKVVAGFGGTMVTSTVSVAANSTTWTHVMASFDAASNELRLFVNDQPEAGRICPVSPRSSGVGLTHQTVGEGFRGWIDEVRVWDRALDTMLVALAGDEDGLVSYYRFDDGTSFKAGTVGTSGCGLWQHGQVEDFTSAYATNWTHKWFDAATLRGNARLTSNNLNWQPVMSDDTDSDGMPDVWESGYPGALLLLVDDSREDYDGDGWDNYSEMMWGLVQSGCSFADSTNPTNPTNYPTPAATFTFRYDSTKGLAATGTVIHAEVFSTYTMNGVPDASIDIPAAGAVWGDSPFVYTTTNGFDVGHLRQGEAWVYAFLDGNGNGSWDAGEPAGTGQYQSSVRTAAYGVNVDVGPVAFTVGLSDELFGYPRFAWPAAGGGGTKVTIKNLSVTGLPTVLQTNIYNRSYFHEGDLQAALGAGSLGRNTYQWLYGNTIGGTVTYDWPTTVNTPALEWPGDGSFLTEARNEFRWTLQTNVTQYTLSIRNESTLATVLQKTYDVKYSTASGRYRFELPIFAGDKGFEDGRYSWTIEAKQPRPATKLSSRRYFTVDLRATPLGPYSISGTVVAQGLAAVTGGTYVVQAFQNGFSGPGEAAEHVSAKGPRMFKLEGLAAGTYYVKAFLDQDGDNVQDAWESFGYVVDPLCAHLSPLAMAVPGATVGKVVWVNHVDTDHDTLPDAWEYQYFGDSFSSLTLPRGRDDDPDADGLSNLEEYNVGTNPMKADTDGDGINDYAEVSVYGTNPTLLDTDGDGISDSEEVTRGTSGTSTDSDADGIPDGAEVAMGLDPLVADDDNDGISSFDEINWDGLGGYAPYKPSLGTGTDLNALKVDTDEDGVNDLEEVASGSDPLNPSDAQHLVITGIVIDAGGAPVVSWPIWANMGGLPLTFRLEASTDLLTWTVVSTVAIDGMADGMAIVPDAVSSGPVYYRLKVGFVSVADCGGGCP